MIATARSEPTRASAAERTLCILFHAGPEAYAIPALDVQKVVEPGRLNRLPSLPGSILGITHHRGRIVTVVDLAGLFGAVRTPPQTASARILVLDRGQRNIGLHVDAVDQIGPVRTAGDRRGGELAVVQHQGRGVSLVDTDRLLERIYGLTREEVG